jgi:prophage tail gpP-like protein
MAESDDLTLRVAGQTLSGWTSVRVTASVDRCPRDFEIGMTERYPGEFNAVSVNPGDACEVFIGADRVITGYVDRLQPMLTSGQHAIVVVGRGQCADLVDCSADWPSNQISNVSIIQLAQKLCDKFGIVAEAVGDDPGIIPQINLLWGETSYEVIERVARYEGLLVYETPGGSLMLAGVGTATHVSGFAQGVNVERAVANYGVDQRFSKYLIRLLSMSLPIEGVGSDIIEVVSDEAMALLKLRNGKPRERLKYIIAETGDQGGDLETAKRRGAWEAAFRAGRSFNVALTVDSWRDGAGVLWSPNNFARVQLPSLKVADVSWVISEVIYRRDAEGTHADLVLMPPEALKPEPFLLVPVLRGVVTPAVAPNSAPSQQ